MYQYVANKNVFSYHCQQPDLSNCQAESSTPTDRPRKMPFGRRCWACSAARPVIIGWRSGDVAATRRRRPVGRNPTGTGVLVHAGSWTPWRRVCTRVAEVHRANVAHHEWAATSLGRTCVCRWPHELRRSALVATCRSSPSARLPRWHCSCRCAKRRTRGRVWPSILCRVNAENAEVDELSLYTQKINTIPFSVEANSILFI